MAVYLCEAAEVQAAPIRLPMRHVIETVEPRIHFALVCGANSSPPISIFQPDILVAQLDLAARNFINDGGVMIKRAVMTVSVISTSSVLCQKYDWSLNV